MAETVNSTFMAQPAGSEDPSLGDDRIRAFKTAWKERLEKEHHLDLTEAGSQPRQGLHKAGSAVAFYQSAAPTTRNGVSLAAADVGLIWVDSDDGQVYTWSGSAWIRIGRAKAFYQGSAPTGLGASEAGFLWIDSDNLELFIWTGSAWVGNNGYRKLTYSTAQTLAALDRDTEILVTGAVLINASAGAAAAGIRLRVQGLNVAATLQLRTGGTISIQNNAVEAVWDGTYWVVMGVENPIMMQEYSGSSSSGNYTVPVSGVYTVELIGGGGGAGGTNGSLGQLRIGGGGGAGAYVKARSLLAATSVQAYVVGNRGSGGSGYASGGNGTASSFGSFSANAGSGGGGSNADSIPLVVAGAGGAGGESTVITGGVVDSTPGRAGLGGIAVGPGVSATGLNGGVGGDSRQGRGGNVSTGTAVAGANPGGGGGSVAKSDSGSSSGGAGGFGLVRVWLGLA